MFLSEGVQCFVVFFHHLRCNLKLLLGFQHLFAFLNRHLLFNSLWRDFAHFYRRHKRDRLSLGSFSPRDGRCDLNRFRDRCCFRFRHFSDGNRWHRLHDFRGGKRCRSGGYRIFIRGRRRCSEKRADFLKRRQCYLIDLLSSRFGELGYACRFFRNRFGLIRLQSAKTLQGLFLLGGATFKETYHFVGRSFG